MSHRKASLETEFPDFQHGPFLVVGPVLDKKGRPVVQAAIAVSRKPVAAEPVAGGVPRREVMAAPHFAKTPSTDPPSRPPASSPVPL